MLTNVESCERRKVLRAIASYLPWGSLTVLGRYQQDYCTFRKANARGPHLMRVRYSSLVVEQNAAVALFRRFVILVSRYWICHLEKVSLGLRSNLPIPLPSSNFPELSDSSAVNSYDRSLTSCRCGDSEDYLHRLDGLAETDLDQESASIPPEGVIYF